MTMIVVDAEQVRRLRDLLPALTKAHLQETLGISETTWVRLRDRRPIRQSTYERLLKRSMARSASPAKT
ncbi:hypothetical protein [Caulobacter sp. BP25]|uniref:hypothetical protein n=1 Tax=Caulobacter sp. BP25 TaxID=2048900 RepID=UPI000C12A9EC|nr:hypothetical protein [Caulobacter sp. BP25]PHY18108.1 hypothetical protein CSW59_15150 [Caulobacter sp. BP25]